MVLCDYPGILDESLIEWLQPKSVIAYPTWFAPMKLTSTHAYVSGLLVDNLLDSARDIVTVRRPLTSYITQRIYFQFRQQSDFASLSTFTRVFLLERQKLLKEWIEVWKRPIVRTETLVDFKLPVLEQLKKLAPDKPDWESPDLKILQDHDIHNLIKLAL